MQTPTDIGQQQRTHALRRERAPPEHERSDQRHDQQQKMLAKAETVESSQRPFLSPRVVLTNLSTAIAIAARPRLTTRTISISLGA